MAKIKDSRNWEEEYKKLKINFDRLDRFNDVLYRYFWTINKPSGVTVNDMREAREAVEKYMEELGNERTKVDS